MLFGNTDLFLIFIAMQLRILSLNVQGFRDVGKQRNGLRLGKSVRCDLLLVQETNFRCYQDVIPFEAEHCVKGLFSFGRIRSEAVGIIVLKPSLLRNCVSFFDNQGRDVCLDVYLQSTRYRVITVYGPARRGALNDFFKNIDTFMLDPAPLFLAGDFNCVVEAARDTRGS